MDEQKATLKKAVQGTKANPVKLFFTFLKSMIGIAIIIIIIAFFTWFTKLCFSYI